MPAGVIHWQSWTHPAKQRPLVDVQLDSKPRKRIASFPHWTLIGKYRVLCDQAKKVDGIANKASMAAATKHSSTKEKHSKFDCIRREFIQENPVTVAYIHCRGWPVVYRSACFGIGGMWHVSNSMFVLWDRGPFCSPGWPPLTVLRPQPPNCWDSRSEPPGWGTSLISQMLESKGWQGSCSHGRGRLYIYF